MPESSLLPLWDPEACVPREEVLTGTLTDSDLALRLDLVVSGHAKVPYNDPRSFFASTHMTRNMRDILQYIFGRLSRARADSNPVVVLDVGFGGGKTHTLVTLYYAAKYGNDAVVRSHLTGIPVPENTRIAAISGEDYGGLGVKRGSTNLTTLWGDLFYQLGVYDRFRDLDISREVPSLTDVKEALGDGPLLVLLDELPTYLNLIGKHDRKMMDKVVQFIQRLVNAVAEKENAALVIAIAEDAYKNEAILARESIRSAVGRFSDEEQRELEAVQQAAQEAMDGARAFIRRKEYIMSPVEESDAVHILKRRLFSSISPNAATKAADEYYNLYNSISVPDKYKKIEYRDAILESYPFHPDLIAVLYERIATLDRFNRTRGALRLLTRVIRNIWQDKEADAFLIHPYHIDHSIPGVMEDLTKGIGDERMRNAIEADIWRSNGEATAQEFDEEVKAQWKAPLHRRTCNTIYLYSITPGRQGDHGIDADVLVTLMAVPGRSEYALRVRDGVLRKLHAVDFHYIDWRGTNFLFIRELNPFRVIDREAKNIIDQEAIAIVKRCLSDLFSDTPEWVHVDIFPMDPSQVEDKPVIKLAILNPHLHHSLPESGEIPESVERFITHSDSQGTRYRKFKNDTFILVAEQSRLGLLWDTARKIKATREVRKDPESYGIPKDRKSEVEEYLSEHEKSINDHVRSAFSKFILYNKEGKIQQVSLNPNGYSGGKKGKEMFAYHLKDVFGRVSLESFDPARVETDAWKPGAPYVSVETLFDTFHNKPGLTIPATQKSFRETVTRGVRERFWVLKHQKNVYTESEIPSSIEIDKEWEIWKREEAKRQGLLNKPVVIPEPLVKDPGNGGGNPVRPPTPTGPIPFNYSFVDSPASVLANDLETYTKREGIKKLDRITIKSENDTSVLYAIRNLITRVGPVDCQVHLAITAQRFTYPKFNIAVEFTKENIRESSAKAILETLPRLQGPDLFTSTLTLDKEGTPVDTISQLLRELPKTNADTLFKLEIAGSKEHV